MAAYETDISAARFNDLGQMVLERKTLRSTWPHDNLSKLSADLTKKALLLWPTKDGWQQHKVSESYEITKEELEFLLSDARSKSEIGVNLLVEYCS